MGKEILFPQRVQRGLTSWLAGWLVLLGLWAGPLGAAQDTAGDLVSRMVELAAVNADGQRNAELEALRQRLSLLPKPRPGDKQKARKAYDDGNKVLASYEDEEFERFVTQEKDKEAFAKGLASFKARQYKQALPYYQAAYKADPSDVEITNRLSRAYVNMRDFSSAYPLILDALVTSSGRGMAWVHLADYFGTMNQPREAVACFLLMIAFSESTGNAIMETTLAAYAITEDNSFSTREAAKQALEISEKRRAQNLTKKAASSPQLQAPLPAMPTLPLAPMVKTSPPSPATKASPSSPAPLPTPPPSNPNAPTAPEASPSMGVVEEIPWSSIAKSLWTKLQATIADFVAVLWGWPLAVAATLSGLVFGVFFWRKRLMASLSRSREALQPLVRRRRFADRVPALPGSLDVVGVNTASLGILKNPVGLGLFVVAFLLGSPFFPGWWSLALAAALVVLLLWWHRYPTQRQALIDFMTSPTTPRFIAAGILILSLVAGFVIGPKGGGALFCGATVAASVFRAWHSRHRVAWLMALYYSVLAMIGFWLFSMVVDDLITIYQSVAPPHKELTLDPAFNRFQQSFKDSFGRLADAYRTPATGSTASLIITLWALFGTLVLAIIGADPRRWVHPKGIAWGFNALFLMTGRPIIYWVNAGYGWFDSLFGLMPVTWQLVIAPLLLIPLGFLMVSAPVALFFLIYFMLVVPVVMVFNQLMEFENNLIIFRYQRSGLIGYLVRFGYWLRGEPLPNVPDDSKGARFATPQEAADLQHLDGAVFGHVNGAPLRLRTDKHVLLMASTRSGKGVAIIIPHLLRYRGSAFVLDPKGENARATGRRRAFLNDQVQYLDPFGLSGQPQSRFNPLARFTPANMEAESKALAAALVMGEGSTRDHWTSSAQQLLAALILYVVASPDLPQDKKDLPTVRRLLLGAMDTVLAAMAQSDLADGLLADLGASFLKTPEKEFGSILSTAQRETEILDNPFIAASLAATGPGREVAFAAWHRGTMTVYLCLSAPKFPVFNRWLRLILTSALDEMTDRLDPPKLPVCFMLDELATLGHLQAVENAVGLAAGYGIQLWNVFQDVAQMRDLYKGRWASFVGNADVRALFNLDDYETAEYWSKTIGGHLVPSTSYSQNIYGQTHGQTSSETFRPLLTPEDIMRQFAAGKMLVLPQGAFPIVAQRVPYFQDPELTGLWDDPRPPVARG